MHLPVRKILWLEEGLLSFQCSDAKKGWRKYLTFLWEANYGGAEFCQTGFVRQKPHL